MGLVIEDIIAVPEGKSVGRRGVSGESASQGLVPSLL